MEVITTFHSPFLTDGEQVSQEGLAQRRGHLSDQKWRSKNKPQPPHLQPRAPIMTPKEKPEWGVTCTQTLL